MKKTMTVAAIALMMAGSTAFACSGCGCTAKKDKDKTEKKECTKTAEKTNTCSSCTSTAK